MTELTDNNTTKYTMHPPYVIVTRKEMANAARDLRKLTFNDTRRR